MTGFPLSFLMPIDGPLVDAGGTPRFGRHAGYAGRIDWTLLAPPHARSAWWRRFHHKRWQYVALSSPQLFCGIAVVDVGWTSTAFAYAFDRAHRRLVAGYSRDGLPGMGARVAHGLHEPTRFRFLKERIEFVPLADRGGYRLSLRCGRFAIDAEMACPPPEQLLLAVGPVDRGAVHATQKSGALACSGTVSTAEGTYGLDGATASLDYSNGLLARETSWRWASAHAPHIGFNLQAGYFGDAENVLWLDGRMYPLGAAQFDHDAADPAAAWTIRTADGVLDLHFEPEGWRREDKDLLVAASRYLQPIGRFSGEVRLPGMAPRRIADLVGVTENHFSRW